MTHSHAYSLATHEPATLILRLRGEERRRAVRIAAEVNADYRASGDSGGFIPAVIVCGNGHRTPTAVPEDYPGSAWGCDECRASGTL